MSDLESYIILILLTLDALPIFNRHFQYDFSVQNSPYDFRSITHFGNKAYSKHIRRMRMQQTIVSKYDVNEPLGGVTLTRYDILHINKLYHCGADYRGDSKYDVSAGKKLFNFVSFMGNIPILFRRLLLLLNRAVKWTLLTFLVGVKFLYFYDFGQRANNTNKSSKWR